MVRRRRTRQTRVMRVAALLRGINIGASKRIAMPALREIVDGPPCPETAALAASPTF